MNQTKISKKDQVLALLKSIESGDRSAAAVINPERYIQHNLAVADGIAGFGAFLQSLPQGSSRARPVRIYEDGDFVFAHTEYDLLGPKIGFDVFRFEKGLIVEHWDNLQEKAASANASGHTMIDGPTEPGDLDGTEANKALVRGFLETVLVQGKMDRMAEFFDGDRYVQHNPRVPDGLSGLGAAIAEMAKHGIFMRFTKVHRVLGQGNFVLAMSEGTFGDKPTCFYDLFRIEGGKIAEHWDTIETIPPQSDWRNSNGKF